MTGKRRFEITDARGGTALPVRVVTQAEAAEIVGLQEDGVLKVRLVASPAGDPAANAELIQLLASVLGVARNKLEIVAGEHTREKIVSVEGLTSAEVESLLGLSS
jgi:hypothetical protein